MDISILGTGIVGRTLSEKLIQCGHSVMMGTREVAQTLERTSRDAYGSPPFSEWYAHNQEVKLGRFAEAAAYGDCVVNALQGGAVLEVLNGCNGSDFDQKIIIDISNPLDFSRGFPPSLIDGLNNTYSLGEAIQDALPNARVVKTLNTMNCFIMANPAMVNQGDHVNFICGNDAAAKSEVMQLLGDFGWKNEHFLDLGDISQARGSEAVLLIWVRIFAATQNGAFNFKIVK